MRTGGIQKWTYVKEIIEKLISELIPLISADPHWQKLLICLINPLWTASRVYIRKCFSCFFLILYISNWIKNTNIFFPPQKLKIWRHGEKNQLFAYFEQKLKTAILDLFSTKLKVQDLKSKKKKKSRRRTIFGIFCSDTFFAPRPPLNFC